jgi:GNAT superfamily N-acetyltransferase
MSSTTTPSGLPASKVTQIETVERKAWLDMFAAAPPETAAELGLEQRALHGGALLICRRLDGIQFNRLSLGTHSPARETALDFAISEFERAGMRNWAIQVPEGSDSLEEMCARKGLVRHSRTWVRFIRGPEPASSTTKLTIGAVGPDMADAFGAVVAQAYGLPPSAAQWLSAIVGRPYWTCFMASDGQTPVATGAVFLDGASAWLGIGATLPSHRGRGAQSGLLAARIEAAVRQGCDTLTTETGVPLANEAGHSYRNIQRAGFRIAHVRYNLCRPQG